MSSALAPNAARGDSDGIFASRFPRCSSVVPLNPDGEEVAGTVNTPADFQEILKAAVQLGLVVPRSLWDGKKNAWSSFLRFWNLFLAYVRTTLLLFYFYCHGYFWLSVVMQISFGAQIVLGYGFIWFFAIKQSTKKNLLRKLFSLSPAGVTKETSLVRVKLLLIAFVIGAFSWTASKFLYFAAWNTQVGRLKPLLDFTEDADFLYYFNWMLNFSFIFSYYSGAATLYVLALLCAQSYRSCGKLFTRYGQALEKEAQKRSLTVDAISKKQAEIREIISCVRGVDQTLNGCAIVLYGTVMNDIFSAISGAYSSLKKAHGSVEYDVFLALKALVATTTFFYLTYSGSSVSEEKLVLQKRMIRILGLIMKNSPCTSVVMAYESLYSTIKYADVSVTILDLFDIKKTLILTAAGFYFTYGVYMYQFVTAPND